MSWLYLGIGVVIGGGTIYYAFVFRQLYRHHRRIRQKVAPIIEAVKTGREAPMELIHQAAAGPHTRNFLYRKLDKLGRTELFPAEFMTAEAVAESDMVHWLSHPTNLDGPPHRIQLVEKVTLDSGTGAGLVNYFVFKFRTLPPHWAAEEGWMAGVAGPYPHDARPVPGFQRAAFSQLHTLDSQVTQKHVNHRHELALRKGLYRKLEKRLKQLEKSRRETPEKHETPRA